MPDVTSGIFYGMNGLFLIKLQGIFHSFLF